MTPTVFFLVLAAAFLHAGWNAVIKIRLDPFLAMTLLCLACGIIAVPALILIGLPPVHSWPWVAASVAMHFGYYVFLSEAYRRADMGQIYPIARGAAPLLTTVISLSFLGVKMSPGSIAGVALLGGSVALLALRGHRRTVQSAGSVRVAIAFALLTAATIAGYTVIDGIGARVARNAHAYAAMLFTFDALPMLALCLARHGLAGMRPMRAFLWPGLAGGAMSLAAYWIVIWAMTVAPVPLVAAVRESSVLFAGLISVFLLKEPFSRLRAAGAVLTVAGLVMVRLF